ncbi:MAG: TonB-dependent receptor, partial [Acidobacteria bacterium]|nr:TonB-dependent receptor [Acidobacteriota bacterium]
MAVALGQGERATVTGVVTDSSGAIVVGAEVTIRNVATNVITRTKTNAAGIYYLPALPPGRYELRVESGGFRPAVVADIPLGAGLTATFNLTLEVGTVTEAVEVQATAVQLESQTSGLGKILATRSIAELPALGRNPLTLLATIPGVQPVGGATSLANSQYKMSGGTATQNGLLTDGGENRAFRTSTNSVVPLESIAEMRVDTATYAAEFGRSGGGVINLVTKSGTNQIHGVGYEFLRNDHLNANSWQNNRSAVRKGLYQQNQFGAAVGGPIVHDRTFFFFNYEAVRQGTPIQNLSTVPTEAQRRGQFTGTLDAGARQIIVYDPTTTRADPSQSGRFIRDPFSGNSIPQARINPVSLNVLKYWPAANRPGEGPSNFNNYFKSAKSITPSNFYLARIDHVISEKHRLFGRFNARQTRTLTSGLGAEDVAFISRSISSSPVRNALVSLTSTFTPSLLGE